MGVAALNCAEQDSCAEFDIQGTPTLRLFYPNAVQGDQGIDIEAGVRNSPFSLK